MHDYCMTSQTATNPRQEPTLSNHKQERKLIGMIPCLHEVFPDEATRPGERTFHEWKKRGYFPHVKIGKRVFVDPVEVRKALDKRFTIEAID